MARQLIQGTIKGWHPSKGHMSVGASASLTRAFTAADVAAYAQLAGDDNPVHLDEKYAATTRFKKPIVHGMLYSSLFGTIFGATIPGAIYMSQNFKFRQPVYVGETITASVEVTSVRTKPFHSAVCRTLITKGEGDKAQVATEGEAIVMLPEPTNQDSTAVAAGKESDSAGKPLR